MELVWLLLVALSDTGLAPVGAFPSKEACLEAGSRAERYYLRDGDRPEKGGVIEFVCVPSPAAGQGPSEARGQPF